MALPAKERFKEPALKERASVVLTIDKEPDRLKFKHKSWPYERELTVLGRSKDSDLMTDISIDNLANLESAAQYILGDSDMNIYEGVIYVLDTENGTVGYLVAIKSKPHK